MYEHTNCMDIKKNMYFFIYSFQISSSWMSMDISALFVYCNRIRNVLHNEWETYPMKDSTHSINLFPSPHLHITKQFPYFLASPHSPIIL